MWWLARYIGEDKMKYPMLSLGRSKNDTDFVGDIFRYTLDAT